MEVLIIFDFWLLRPTDRHAMDAGVSDEITVVTPPVLGPLTPVAVRRF